MPQGFSKDVFPRSKRPVEYAVWNSEEMPVSWCSGMCKPETDTARHVRLVRCLKTITSDQALQLLNYLLMSQNIHNSLHNLFFAGGGV